MSRLKNYYLPIFFLCPLTDPKKIVKMLDWVKKTPCFIWRLFILDTMFLNSYLFKDIQGYKSSLRFFTEKDSYGKET